MFKIFRSIKILLLVVFFMVLAVIASVNFGNNEESKNRLKDNYFFKLANDSVSFLVLGVNTFSNLSLNNNINFLKNNEKLKSLDLKELGEEFKEKTEGIEIKSEIIQDKTSEINLDNKFNNFLSFFQDQFVKLKK